jgi:hypothetical protein
MFVERGYLTNRLATKLSLSGGTMTGTIDFSGEAKFNLPLTNISMSVVTGDLWRDASTHLFVYHDSISSQIPFTSDVTTATNNSWLSASNAIVTATNNSWLSASNALLTATNNSWLSASNAIVTATNNSWITASNAIVTATNQLVSTGQLYTASEFTNAVVAIGSARYQATNAALTRFIANQYALAVLSPPATTNFYVDFSIPETYYNMTNGMYFVYSTNSTASTTIAQFHGVTIYNDTATGYPVTFNTSWRRLGASITNIGAGKMVRISLGITRGTAETNVYFGASQQN